MGNLLAKGAAFLAQQQRRHMSSMVAYLWHGTTLHIPAVRGKTDSAAADSGGALVDVRTDDWLIDVRDMDFGGVLHEPTPGDRITDPATGAVYEVAGNPPWRWSDVYHNRYRIHVNEVAP